MASREQVEALQLKISPFMLRRVKEDVAKDIPAKEETVIDVELTSIQKQYYRAIFEHNHAFLAMGTARTAAPKLMVSAVMFMTSKHLSVSHQIPL